MKSITNLIAKNEIMFLFFFLGTITIDAQDLTSQKNKIGVSVANCISGNGHGSIYIPQLNITHDRNIFLIGACMQKQAMQFNGTRLAYSFSFLGRAANEAFANEDDTTGLIDYLLRENGTMPIDVSDEPRIGFKAFAYVEYLRNNLLSRCAQKMEEHTNRVEGQNWKTATLSTVEAGLGMQIGFKLKKNLYWSSFVAGSFYYHTKYIQNMHHERLSPCLTLGTSITIPDIHV